jgi:hypothetical protein
MKKFMTLGFQNLVGNARLLKLGLVILAGLMVNAGRAQDNFASAQVISGDSGSVTNYNIGVVADSLAPNIAGYAPNAPLWYQWTPTTSGEVEMDTVGSMDFSGYYMLDTVVGIYTGSGLSDLNQVAANDDLYPVNSTLPNETQGRNYFGSSDIAGFYYPGITLMYQWEQQYYGPSHLRVNVTAGTKYYIAVDAKTTSASGAIYGAAVLNWSFKSSGVFRFATEDYDYWTGYPQ